MGHGPPDVECYAGALLALAEAAGREAEVERDLVAMLDLLECDEEVRRFLADRSVRKAGKKKALEQLLDGRICHVLVHFLLILQEEKLLREVRPIAESFFAQYSSRRQQVTGTLTSAVQISPEQVEKIEQEAGHLLGKNVHLRVRIDAGILGGLRIQVGDFIVDGTVEHDLAVARRDLLARKT